MCAIIGTRNINSIMPLYELNSYRGKHSHSIAVYDIKHGDITILTRGVGELKESVIDTLRRDYNRDNYYYIVHSQAPTSEGRSSEFIHPAHHNGSYLWHNGIIKAVECDRLRNTLGSDSQWDTQLLLMSIIDQGNLNNLDGSFACLLYHRKRLFMFRNEISPLFVDFDFNISSTKPTGDWFSVVPNRVYSIDFVAGATAIESTFNTFSSPYLL